MKLKLQGAPDQHRQPNFTNRLRGGKQNAQQASRKAIGTTISNLYGHLRKQGEQYEQDGQGKQGESSAAEKQE